MARGLQLIPFMTSNTAPSGVATASASYPTIDHYYAYGKYPGWVNNGGATGYVQYQFPSPKLVTCYGITPWSVDTYPTRSPKTWTLQGSMDGASYDTLDTQTNYASWTQWVPSYFTFANKIRYLYYKLNITANGGDGYLGLEQLFLFQDIPGYIYLHARRDRMNRKGVSTQNILE